MPIIWNCDCDDPCGCDEPIDYCVLHLRSGYPLGVLHATDGISRPFWEEILRRAEELWLEMREADGEAEYPIRQVTAFNQGFCQLAAYLATRHTEAQAEKIQVSAQDCYTLETYLEAADFWKVESCAEKTDAQ